MNDDVTVTGGLYDCARLARELGISRRAADAIMLRVPKQHVPGIKKVWVRGSDVLALLDKHQVDATVKTPLNPSLLRRAA